MLHKPFRSSTHKQFDIENSKCSLLLMKIACKMPVLLVLGITGADTYFLFGYSRLVLAYELGQFPTDLLLLLYSISMTILQISYFRCMLTSSAVKDNPPPPELDISHLRKCEKCGQLKPPRTHHCSLCRTCILKMDHHCLVNK